MIVSRDAEKSLNKNTMFHDGNTQQTKHRKKPPQPVKKINKKSSVVTYLIVKD